MYCHHLLCPRVDEPHEVGVLRQEHHGVEFMPQVVVAVHADAEYAEGEQQHEQLDRPLDEGAPPGGEEGLQRTPLLKLLQPRDRHLSKGRVSDGGHLQAAGIGFSLIYKVASLFEL